MVSNRKLIQQCIAYLLIATLVILISHRVIDERWHVAIEFCGVTATAIVLFIIFRRAHDTETSLHHDLLVQALQSQVLFEEAPIALIEITNGLMTRLNRTALRLFDAEDLSVLIGTEFTAHFSPRSRDDINRRLLLKQRDGEHMAVSDDALVLQRRDGTSAMLEMIRMPNMGWSDSTQVALIDITQRVASEAVLRQSEQRLALAMEGSRDALWDWDLLSNTIYRSPRWWSMLGYAADELDDSPQMTWQLMHPDDMKRVRTFVTSAISGDDNSYQCDMRLRHKDGFYVPISCRGLISRDSNGKAVRVSGTNTDMSERHRFENALREDSKRLGAFIANLPGFVYRVQHNAQLIAEYISTGVTPITGRDVADYLGEPPSGRAQDIHPDDLPFVLERIEIALARHIRYEFEYRLINQQGGVVWVWERGEGVSNDQGQITWLEGFVTDITNRKLAERALQQQADMLTQMGAMAKIGGWDLSADGAVLQLSPQAIQTLCYPPDQPLTLNGLTSLFAGDVRIALHSCIETALASGTGFDLRELALVTHELESRTVRVMGMQVHEGSRLVGLTGVIQDMTELHAAKAALEREKTWLKAILDSAIDAKIVINSSGTIVMSNPAATQTFGFTEEELIGQSISLLMPEPHRSNHGHYIQRYLDTGEKHIIGIRRELVGLRKNGETFPMDLSVSSWSDGQDIFFTGVVRDITERRMVQAQLIQSQKMESLSQLSGGLAHDFNNLLGIITGNLDFLEGRLANDEKGLQRVHSALRAAERGADITRRMLAISRQRVSGQRVAESQDVNRLIENLSAMLGRMLGPNYLIKLQLADDACACAFDPAEFENVLLNLSINARDAMPGGGTIQISTQNLQSNDLLEHHASSASSGRYLEIAFADTGTGMSEAVRARALEPFFTTKAAKGTGLGLAMVASFIKDAGGKLEILSEEGVGTTFLLRLPAAQSGTSASPNPGAAASIEVVMPHAAAGETILVVDDEADLLQLTSAHLQSLGYTTLTAASGANALAILQSDTHIDLLLTDVVMPGGMFGTELALKARELRAGLPVILCSGFPQTIHDKPEYAVFASTLMAKPFRKLELATRVRNALTGIETTNHAVDVGVTNQQ